MSVTKEPLFTPRFFLMCGFTFTVFVSAFQLFPTAPFHIKDLGGSTFAAGLFLAFLTYASALSAPVTGSLADRFGLRRTLITSGIALTLCSVGYAVVPDVRLMLALVVLHGVFWSGLLTASSAYTTSFLPASRRAEGIGYWGFASVGAIAVAPTLGFWLYGHGWVTLVSVTGALNLAMTVIAWRLPEEHVTRRDRHDRPRGPLIEWRVLALSMTLLLYSFAYGGITSFAAMYAEANHVTPKAIYLTVLALAILVTRPLSGSLADRIGYVRVLVPCLALISMGLSVLAIGGSRPVQILSAAIFGIGFGSAYPIYAAYVLDRIDETRRAAAFGAILMAFDTGIGTGSLATGWLIQRYGFESAFGIGAAVSALALPYFLAVRRVLPHRRPV
jgi:MFS family permease